MTMCHFWAWNPPLAPKIIFFQKKPYNFHAPVSPFHCENFSKNSWSWSRVLSMHHLRDQNGTLAQTEFFLQKVTTYSWSIYFLQSLCKIWRKSFEQLKRRLKICTFYLPFPLSKKIELRAQLKIENNIEYTS